MTLLHETNTRFTFEQLNEPFLNTNSSGFDKNENKNAKVAFPEVLSLEGGANDIQKETFTSDIRCFQMAVNNRQALCTSPNRLREQKWTGRIIYTCPLCGQVYRILGCAAVRQALP